MNRPHPSIFAGARLMLLACLLPCLIIACQPSTPPAGANNTQEKGANLAGNAAPIQGAPLDGDTKSSANANQDNSQRNDSTLPDNTSQSNRETENGAGGQLSDARDNRQDEKQSVASNSDETEPKAPIATDDEGPMPEIPASFTRIDPEQEVWVDRENKQVLVGGRICFREGALEFFACVRGSKEHESVVAAYALSSKVHLGLLSIGLEPGQPVQWDPEYRAASGPPVQIDVLWLEEGQQKERPAKEMVYNARTESVLDVDWVFGGSRFYKDPETDQEFYLGDGGEMISVSNFSTATMDLPIESSFVNEWLLFTAKTENIPPLGTRVLLRLSAAKK